MAVSWTRITVDAGVLGIAQGVSFANVTILRKVMDYCLDEVGLTNVNLAQTQGMSQTQMRQEEEGVGFANVRVHWKMMDHFDNAHLQGLYLVKVHQGRMNQVDAGVL